MRDENTVKEEQEKSRSVQALLLAGFGPLLIGAVFLTTLYYSDLFLSSPAASPGSTVTPLLHTTTVITVIVLVITQILLFFFVYKFRSREGHKATYIRGYLRLEMVWTIIPALVFILLFLWGQNVWHDIITLPEEDPVVIEIMAEQFNWHARYPGADNKLGRSAFRLITEKNDLGVDRSDQNSEDDFIPLEMHVPKNRPVVLLLHSKDVIHSFYVPSFGIKMDAVPGMTTNAHFTATRSTREMREMLNDPEFNFEVACAELCGRMHFAMKLILVVDEPDQYELWCSKQKNIF